ncbi:MAG: FHA domain-containing protein, partial [Planctomycetota bacterium]
ETVVLGRDPETDVLLDERGVAPRHAKLAFGPAGISLSDCSEGAGITVNGQAINRTVLLTRGDRVALGSVELMVTDGSLLGSTRLLCVAGPAAGIEQVVNDAPAIIGRRSSADIQLPDAAVSGKHARIRRDGASVVLEDLGSNNGTLVGGKPISVPTALHGGTRVTIGKNHFVYIDGRTDDLANTAIAGHVLLDRIGAGSTGVVYAAKDRNTGEQVAVKFFDPAAGADTAERARLQNAIRALRRVEDPHVVPVFRGDVHGDLLYLVMPWYANGSLRDLIHLEEDLPTSVLLSLIADAAAGLEAADTRHGLKHDGLRPGDILIDDDGAGRVADFGLSRRSPRPAGDTQLAVTQFELGVILRTALRGGHDRGGRKLDDLRGREDVPAPALTCIERMTEADPAARYASWDDLRTALATALKRSLGGVRPRPEPAPAARQRPAAGLAGPADRRQPGTARKPRGEAPRRRRGSRVPGWVIALIACAVAGLLLLIVGPMLFNAARSQTKASERRLDAARKQPAQLEDSLDMEPPAHRDRADERQARSFRLPPPVTGADDDDAPATQSPARIGGQEPETGQRPADDTPALAANETSIDHPAAGPVTHRGPVIEPGQGTRNTSDDGTPPPDNADDTALQDAADVVTEEADGTDEADEPATVADQPEPEAEAEAEADEPATVADQPEPEGVTDDPVAVTEDASTEEDDPALADATDTQIEDDITPMDPERIRERLAAARPDTWEEVRLVLADGERIEGEAKVDGIDSADLTLRRADGSTTTIAVADLARFAYQKSRDIYARSADRYLDRKDFERAIEKYDRALEKHPGLPYLVVRRAEAERGRKLAATCLTAIPQVIADDNWQGILEHVGSYITLMQPDSLESNWREPLREAYARRAFHMSPEERADWVGRAAAAGVDLTYAENAPELLDAAMAAFTAGEDPDAVYALFTEAREVHAPMDDASWLALAKTSAATKRPELAAEALLSLSPSAADTAEVRELGVAVGLRPPPLDPHLLCLTYIGGAGNQRIQEVGFTSNGTPYAQGNGFRFVFDTTTNTGSVSGDINQDLGPELDRYKLDLRPQTVTVPATGEQVTIRYRQVHGILQQPFLTSDAGWKFWGWGKNEAEQRRLMSDSRGYDTWLFPDGRHIGVMCWCDGGNSVLARHPQDLDKGIEKSDVFNGGYSNVIGGMSIMVMKIDVVERKPVSGTYMASHVIPHAEDRWGRMYIGKQMGRRHAPPTVTDHFGLGAEISHGGLFVLDTDLKTNIFHAAIGGTGSSQQKTGAIAIHGNLAIIGGFTDASSMSCVNAVQDSKGAACDALVAVVRLWPQGG